MKQIYLIENTTILTIRKLEICQRKETICKSSREKTSANLHEDTLIKWSDYVILILFLERKPVVKEEAIFQTQKR